MSSLNKAMIIGRLGADPDVRYTQSNTAVANLSVATSEQWKDDQGQKQERTEWHRVVAWGRTAEICQEYLQKGSQVYIEGPIQTRKWEDKEGRDQYTTEIKALRMVMLGSSSGGQGGGGGNRPPHPGEKAYSGQGQKQGQGQGGNQNLDSGVDLNENFDDIDDDLPF